MSEHIKRIIAALTCAVMLLSLYGCKDGAAVIGSLGKTHTEKEGIDEIGYTLPYLRTDSLNPYTSTGTMNRYISSLMYDSLFAVDSEFKPVNVIAENHSLNSKTLTVTIKSGLKFTDGTALTAKDVVYSFELAKKSTPFIPYLENISQATADGNNKVNFALTAADGDEAANLVFPIIKSGSDVTAAQVESDGDEESTAAAEISSKLPIGSGRYTLVTDSQMKYLQVNKSRLGGYHPEYNKIGLADVADTETLQSLFNLNRIDFYCDDFSEGKYVKFGQISSKMMLTDFVFLGINSNNKVLSDAKVRRAIALALDRTELASVAFAGCAEAVQLPFSTSYYKLKGCTLPTLKCKTDSAVELLESVGYTEIGDSGARYSENNSLNITLLVNSENDFRRSLARSVQQSLEKINIKVTIRECSYSDYASAVESESFDIYIGETKLPNNFGLSRFFSSNGGLRYGIDLKSKTARLYTDYADGKVNMQGFIDSFSDELPFIPIAFRQGIAVSSDTIKTDIVTAPNDCFANINEWTAQ